MRKTTPVRKWHKNVLSQWLLCQYQILNERNFKMPTSISQILYRTSYTRAHKHTHIISMRKDRLWCFSSSTFSTLNGKKQNHISLYNTIHFKCERIWKSERIEHEKNDYEWLDIWILNKMLNMIIITVVKSRELKVATRRLYSGQRIRIMPVRTFW